MDGVTIQGGRLPAAHVTNIETWDRRNGEFEALASLVPVRGNGETTGIAVGGPLYGERGAEAPPEQYKTATLYIQDGMLCADVDVSTTREDGSPEALKVIVALY